MATGNVTTCIVKNQKTLESGCIETTRSLFGMMNLSMLFRQLDVHLFPHTFSGMFAPLDAGNDVVIDNEPTFLAGYFEIVGKYFHFLPALRAFFNRESRGPLVRGTRAPVKHGYCPLS